MSNFDWHTDLLQERDRLAAENEMLRRAMASQPDRATSSGAISAVCNYEVNQRQQTIDLLAAENKELRKERDELAERVRKWNHGYNSMSVRQAEARIAELEARVRALGQEIEELSESRAMLTARLVGQVERLTAIQDKYNELLYAVTTKHPGESRHETALRYLMNAEFRCQEPEEGGEE